MIGKIIWGLVLVFGLVVFPAWGDDSGTDIITSSQPDTGSLSPTDVQSSSILPSDIYSESPFQQSTTIVRLGDVLGSKNGYVHPYVSIGEVYTDNLFNREYNREGDFITRITPGIWAVLPSSRYPLISLNTLNTAPGGLELSRFRNKGTTRLQGYGKFQADILLHDRFDSEDQVNQRAEGYVRYNFRGGLSVDVLDIYELDHDAYGTGNSRQLDRFKSNLVNTSVVYEISPKTRVEGEYGFYTLNYSESRNAYRDREDNSFAGRFYYRFLPKTSLFVEYDYINLNYDKDIVSDSEEHRGYLGVEWFATRKSRMRARVGYGVKDFDAQGSNQADNIIAEIQLRHRFTPKTFIKLAATRQTNETDIAGTAYTLSEKYQIRYFQRILPKLMASANAYYIRNSYRGDGASSGRLDEYYSAGLDLKYSFTNWLALTGGYAFVKRNSSDIGSDYDRNNVFVNLLFAL